MNDLNHSSTFITPLSASVRYQAEQFCHQHQQPQKARQIYLNTLAVYAVQFYLECMGYEVDATASDSWNPAMQALMDVADLIIKEIGKVECCPILPNASTMHIPPEIWSDRVGYVAVQFDASLKTATLLGFTPLVGNGEVPLQQLRSLDDFLAHLQQLKSRTALSQWVQDVVTSGWRSLDELLGLSQPLILSFRNETVSSSTTIRRAKLLNFGLQLGPQSVALLVAVTPESEETLGISVQLHPVNNQPYLPTDLVLKQLSDTGEVLQAVAARNQDNYIQLKRFRAMTGESFDIEVAIADVKITESFTV